MKKLIFIILVALPMMGLQGQVYKVGMSNLDESDTLVIKGLDYDAISGGGLVYILNALWAHRTSTEQITDTTNSGNGEEVYSSVISGDTYKNFALQLQGSSGGSGVTFKVFATLIEDATVPTQWDDAPSGDWYDCSSDVLGGASTTVDSGDSEIYWIDTDFVFYYMIVQAVPDNATNATSVYVRKAY